MKRIVKELLRYIAYIIFGLVILFCVDIITKGNLPALVRYIIFALFTIVAIVVTD